MSSGCLQDYKMNPVNPENILSILSNIPSR